MGREPRRCQTVRMSYLVRFAASAADMDAGYALRHSVFEIEQKIPRPLDRDPFDLNADHVVAFDDAGRCIGTGRAVRMDSRTCQIGRMAVAPDHRRKGVGALVLEALERMASLRGLRDLFLLCQIPAIPFYERHGYVKDGEQFLEHGVPHVIMRKQLAEMH